MSAKKLAAGGGLEEENGEEEKSLGSSDDLDADPSTVSYSARLRHRSQLLIMWLTRRQPTRQGTAREVEESDDESQATDNDATSVASCPCQHNTSD